MKSIQLNLIEPAEEGGPTRFELLMMNEDGEYTTQIDGNVASLLLCAGVHILGMQADNVPGVLAAVVHSVSQFHEERLFSALEDAISRIPGETEDATEEVPTEDIARPTVDGSPIILP